MRPSILSRRGGQPEPPPPPPTHGLRFEVAHLPLSLIAVPGVKLLVVAR